MTEVTTAAKLAPRLAALEELESQRGGFNLENFRRNEMIQRSLGGRSSQLPSAYKTGTTIVGVKFSGGVVLGADTRATGGAEVMDKNCDKIHYIARNMYCCGAGTAADTERTTLMIASQLELLRLNTGSEPRVVTANTLLKRLLHRYQGHIGAALILGGVDVTGAHLYTIHPHGSAWELPYETMGSGSLAAMSVLETQFKEDMTEDEAVQLVSNAIMAGVLNDLGSGSNVDVTIIRNDRTVDKRRSVLKPNEVAAVRATYARPTKLHIPMGTTVVIKESFKPHIVPGVHVLQGGEETKMDFS